ncbi:hypothetical protein O181_014318 [Austropuccinia psidii MF-1]|uniref:Uncharacterized protein n=1 Tax=Austropuccinia psidii MF-1 TaxID=1389203 RepID=A0A9Q3C0B7_9BASI|nr:hypothetical protein [Austropuccinia psidii MF-1]
MHIQMRSHKLLAQIPGELENSVKCRCNQSYTLDGVANTLQDLRKRTNIGRYSQFRSSSLKEKEPFKVEFKDKPKEKLEEVTKKKNTCHNCGSTDHYANNFPKEKKKVPEEESLTEDCESYYMGYSIREKSDDDQGLRGEFLVEYQEETQTEIQDT